MPAHKGANYIAFLDECGDHSLTKIDRDFPVFVLSLIVVDRHEYRTIMLPSVNRLKLDYWQHEGVNLHSRDIRKAQGKFRILQNAAVRKRFMAELSKLMDSLPFELFIVGIHKARLLQQYVKADNPYELALKFVMERLVRLVERRKQEVLPLIAESRGRNEDNSLKATFYDLIQRGTRFVSGDRFTQCDFPLGFEDKRKNIVGLQVADLCAHPAARHMLKPQQPNQAFEIAKAHLFRGEDTIHGWGWKVFP